MMNCRFVFFVHVDFHLVTSDAEFEFIGGLHGGVKTTPENYSRDKKYQGAADRRAPKDAA
jgi:hypothetical protein